MIEAVQCFFDGFQIATKTLSVLIYINSYGRCMFDVPPFGGHSGNPGGRLGQGVMTLAELKVAGGSRVSQHHESFRSPPCQ